MPGRTQITLLACLCAAALAGCGSDEEGTIPPDNSDRLISLLDGIEERVAAGDCETAQKQAADFEDEVNLLPAEVDDEVKAGIQDAAARLEELSNDPSECEDTTGATLDNLEPTTTTTTTAPTTDETTTDTTDETTTTEPEEQDEEEPPAPPEDDDGGQGTGGPPVSPPGGGDDEGTVTIGPGEDEPTSGGIGGDKGPRQ